MSTDGKELPQSSRAENAGPARVVVADYVRRLRMLRQPRRGRCLTFYTGAASLASTSETPTSPAATLLSGRSTAGRCSRAEGAAAARSRLGSGWEASG